MIGLNDIGWPGGVLAPGEAMPSASQLIGDYRQLVARARAHGLRVVGGTLTPFEGAFSDGAFSYFDAAAKERLRTEVNTWLRATANSMPSSTSMRRCVIRSGRRGCCRPTTLAITCIYRTMATPRWPRMLIRLRCKKPEIYMKVKGKTLMFWKKKTFTVRISARTSH